MSFAEMSHFNNSLIFSGMQTVSQPVVSTSTAIANACTD